MHKSISTLDSPEFINLQPLDVNPLISSCEIKVLYLGENRNHSFITEEVASDMAKTLRGAPIVGYYRESKEDFTDHGEKVIFDDEGIKFECMTKPYGFVAPDAKVWFQNFEDTDEFGNTVVRKYLMTTGYLWTGQFEEAKLAIDEGRPQSMELDEESLDGHWATNNNTGMDFFIINDAIFSKLCILGDDVEPCFEGANITAPEVSTSFTKIDETFKQTLYSMMQDLKKYALEGGQSMDNEEKENIVETVETTSVETETEVTEAEETVVENVETQNSTEVQSETESEFTSKEDNKEEEDNEDGNEDKDDKEEKYSLLEKEYNTLQSQFADLQSKYDELVAFKASIEDKEKDALINKFYMLSDEDKADVIANKAKYTLDDIEAKLSIICVRKKVNFDLEDNSKQDNKEEDVTTTFALSDVESDVPAWVSALKNTQNRNKNI